MAPGCLDLAGAEAVDQGNGEMAESSQNLWGMACPQARPIFSEADIAHIVERLSMLHCPRFSSSKRSGPAFQEGRGVMRYTTSVVLMPALVTVRVSSATCATKGQQGAR